MAVMLDECTMMKLSAAVVRLKLAVLFVALLKAQVVAVAIGPARAAI